MSYLKKYWEQKFFNYTELAAKAARAGEEDARTHWLEMREIQRQKLLGCAQQRAAPEPVDYESTISVSMSCALGGFVQVGKPEVRFPRPIQLEAGVKYRYGLRAGKPFCYPTPEPGEGLKSGISASRPTTGEQRAADPVHGPLAGEHNFGLAGGRNVCVRCGVTPQKFLRRGGFCRPAPQPERATARHKELPATALKQPDQSPLLGNRWLP